MLSSISLGHDLSIGEPIRHGAILQVVLELVRCYLDGVQIAYSLRLLDVGLLNFAYLDPECIHLELRILDSIHDGKTASCSLLTILSIKVRIHGLDFLIGASSPSRIFWNGVLLPVRVQLASL